MPHLSPPILSLLQETYQDSFANFLITLKVHFELDSLLKVWAIGSFLQLFNLFVKYLFEWKRWSKVSWFCHRGHFFLKIWATSAILSSSDKNFFETHLLKELRNRIIRNILVSSLFSLIRLYVGLHFLRFLLEN